MNDQNLVNTPQPEVTQSTPSSSYFLKEKEDFNNNSFKVKLRKYWDAFQYYARQVWPYVYRLINFLVYETIKVIRAIVRIGLQQVGLFKE